MGAKPGACRSLVSRSVQLNDEEIGFYSNTHSRPFNTCSATESGDEQPEIGVEPDVDARMDSVFGAKPDNTL